MARGNYPACKAITLVYEGGTSNHPSDPGGFTSRGVTAAAGASYYKRRGLPPKAVNLWTAVEVDRFYEDDYWLAVSAELLPAGVDLATFDYAVNSGSGRAGKELQRVVDVKADGIVGAGTRLAVANRPGKQVIQALCARRLSFVQGLSTFKVFGRGWSTRIAGIEAKAVAMWLRASGLSPAEVSVQMNHEAGTASGKAADHAKASTGASAGGVLAGGGDIAAGGTTWLLVGAALLILVAIGLLVKSRQDKARAAAYGAEAGVTP